MTYVYTLQMLRISLPLGGLGRIASTSLMVGLMDPSEVCLHKGLEDSAIFCCQLFIYRYSSPLD